MNTSSLQLPQQPPEQDEAQHDFVDVVRGVAHLAAVEAADDQPVDLQRDAPLADREEGVFGGEGERVDDVRVDLVVVAFVGAELVHRARRLQVLDHHVLDRCRNRPRFQLRNIQQRIEHAARQAQRVLHVRND